MTMGKKIFVAAICSALLGGLAGTGITLVYCTSTLSTIQSEHGALSERLSLMCIDTPLRFVKCGERLDACLCEAGVGGPDKNPAQSNAPVILP